MSATPTKVWLVTLVMAVVVMLSAPLAGGMGVAAQQTGPFDPSRFSLELEPVAEGFSRPVVMLDADDGTGRFFVVEQSGTVRILKDGDVADDPFLDISGQISSGNEQGLLGMALHPDFAQNGLFFIDYTDTDGNTRVERWRISAENPDIADPASAELILGVDQPYPNHNGGQLLFGPDGFLYIGLGDGGSGGDPEGNGQNTQTLLGSILRIDIDNPSGDLAYGIPEDNPFASGEGGRPEIFAWGLRNPWRFTFDSETGDLYIGDVGQGEYEEVSVIPAGSKDRNLGWSMTEGFSCYEAAECDTTGLVPPIFAYDHNESGCSVVGGYVYRGAEFPALSGGYLFADYCIGTIWGLGQNANGEWVASDPVETGLNISSFAQDASGELYILDLNGGIYKITAAE